MYPIALAVVPGRPDRIVGLMRRLRSRKNNDDQRAAGVLPANAAKPIEFLVQPDAEATEQTHRSNSRAWLAYAGTEGRRYSVYKQ